MPRPRTKKNRVSHERWLVSYADLLTLMFALFVVLYSAAKSDNKRLAQMSAAIHSGFQQLSASGASPAASDSGGADPALEDGRQQPSLVDLQQQLNAVLSDELTRNDIQIRSTPDGVTVSLKEIGFFPAAKPRSCPRPIRFSRR